MLLTRLPLSLRSVRLACVKPAASVRSEPGSNSHVENSILTKSRSFESTRTSHPSLLPINHQSSQQSVPVPSAQRTAETHPHNKDDVTSLDKRDRQSLFQSSGLATGTAKLRRPRFSFFSICNCQKTDTGPKSQSKPNQRDNPPSSKLPQSTLQFQKKHQSEAIRRRQKRRRLRQ